MKFSLEKGNQNTIHSYTRGQIRIQSSAAETDPETGESMLKTVSGSLILSPDQLIEEWIEDGDELAEEHIQAIIELAPEVVLLGTGDTMLFPEANLMNVFHAARIGVEVMNSSAACRTYNVLAAEGRRVCAAFTEL